MSLHAEVSLERMHDELSGLAPIDHPIFAVPRPLASGARDAAACRDGVGSPDRRFQEYLVLRQTTCDFFRASEFNKSRK